MRVGGTIAGLRPRIAPAIAADAAGAAVPEAGAVQAGAVDDGQVPAASLFASAPLLEALELTETEIADLFGTDFREVEQS